MATCKQCNSAFPVTDAELKFLDRISPVFNGKKYPIPAPTLCPQCRYQRRLLWRAELHLFKRKSDFSGKPILSHFPPTAPCKAYTPQEWWSDEWDPLSYGRDFDFSRPFFDQFTELIRSVPLLSLTVFDAENCDYVNCASWNKNCYLIAAANYDEDCYYGNFVNNCKSCVDNSFAGHSELLYECIDCTRCYNLKYSYNCSNCSDSHFLHNCRNCRHCFGSVNLTDKEFVYLNKPLSKEEYEAKLAGLELHKRSRVAEARAFFEKHRLKFPHKYMMGEQNENVTGNAVYQSRNSFDCFDVREVEDCRYCTWLHQSKDCMDIYAWGFPSTECYECLEAGDNSYRSLFNVTTWHGTDVMYSYMIHGSSNVFGCVSLKKKKYCVFNKQYTKEEYEKLVAKIIEHMQKTGEWGEFFPMRVSLMSYNQTVAQDYVPLTKEQALKLGAKWADEPPVQKPDKVFKVPDSIHDADESICNEILICEKTGKPYKIIPQELRFYKENNIPIPAYCFEARHNDRLRQRNPRRLWDRNCMKCKKPICTSFAPERPEIVYCEPCYLKEVY